MQDGPIVAVRFIAIIRVDAIQPVHGVLMDPAGTRAFAKREAGAVKAADPANTANAATESTDVGSAAEATADAAYVAAAKAAAHATCVAAAKAAAAHTASVSSASAAATRIGLRNRQARRQQGHRQNRDHFSHRLLLSVIGMVRVIQGRAPKLPNELEIGILFRLTTKMTFRQFTLPSCGDAQARIDRFRPVISKTHDFFPLKSGRSRRGA
jgi:hypothetical protein